MSQTQASGPIVILFGPPGSGKTSTAKELSKKIGIPYKDSDQEIVKQTGKEVSEIFLESGEVAFRQIEKKIALDLIHQPGIILALGGGSVMTEEIYQACIDSGALRVYLTIKSETAAKRVGFDKARPMLVVNPRSAWNELMEKRRETYQSLAQITIHNDHDIKSGVQTIKNHLSTLVEK